MWCWQNWAINKNISLLLLLIIHSLWVFLTSTTLWFLLESEGHQVSSGFQNLSQYSSRFWQFCGLYGIDSSLISNSASPFAKSSGTEYIPPYMILIIATFMFPIMFSSLARSKYVSFFSVSFNFIRLSAGTSKFTQWYVLFFLVSWFSWRPWVMYLYFKVSYNLMRLVFLVY